MKTDLLTKVLLAVIAVNLTILSFISLDLIPNTYAAENDGFNSSYGLVPINEDGSINVKFLDVVDVEIVGIDTYDELEVEVESWNSGRLDVSIGSWNARNEIDVNVQNWNAGEIDVCETCH